MEILAAATETLRVPAAVDLAAIVVGALTGGLLAAREGFAVCYSDIQNFWMSE